MLQDIEKYKSISIWVTSDLKQYNFLIEFTSVPQLILLNRHKNLDEFKNKLLAVVEALISKQEYLGYIIQIFYDTTFICLSNLDNLKNNLFRSVQLSLGPIELNQNEILFQTLTLKEKNILFLLAKGHTQGSICQKLLIKICTLKFHRKNIYTKMKFTNKHDLIIWFEKYSIALHLDGNNCDTK